MYKLLFEYYFLSVPFNSYCLLKVILQLIKRSVMELFLGVPISYVCFDIFINVVVIIRSLNRFYGDH